jgi:hypothetical protein
MSALLENWLTEATRKLSEESAARVRSEIEEHYNSAMASGASDQGAVASLGDASRANREYRKVLLTKADAKWLAFVKRRGEGRGPLFPWYAILVTALIEGTFTTPRGALFGPLPFLPMVIFAAVLFVPRWVTIDTRLRSYVYRTVRLGVTLAVPVAFAKARDWNPVFFAYGLSFWTAFFLWAAYKDYLLRRKLPAKEWPKELHL